MPCKTHIGVSNPACVACFTTDLLAFNPKSKSAKATLEGLLGRFEKLKLSDSELETCRAIIAEVNRGLIRQDLYFGEVIQPDQIHREDRLEYCARLRQMGTWIGYYEFTVLARVYRVGFYIAMPSGTPSRWRRYPIGVGPYQHRIVLRWNGTHYDLARLTPVPGSEEFTAAVTRATNPLGDCGLEAFLLLIVLSGVGSQPTAGPNKLAAVEARRLFKSAVRWAGQQVIPADNYDYQRAIRRLREVLAAEMSAEEINLAIIAEGVLPSTRKQPSWHQIMRIDDARTVVLEREVLAPVVIGVVDGGFDTGHASLSGSIHQTIEGDDEVHGTLCCGLIIGDADVKNRYLGGIARTDDYYKLRVTLEVTAYDADNGAEADIERCKPLIESGARVISMSYRALDEKLAVMGNAINDLNFARRGEGEPECTFVVAAGNEGRLYGHQLLALGQNAIVVAATSVYLVRDHYVERAIRDCNRGPGVTVCAPGGGTLGGAKDGELVTISTMPGSKYGPHTNTSAATPMVAGVIALMLSINGDLTPAEIKRILCATAKKIDPLGGEWRRAGSQLSVALIPAGLADQDYSVRYGFGRVDAHAAVLEVVRGL